MLPSLEHQRADVRKPADTALPIGAILREWSGSGMEEELPGSLESVRCGVIAARVVGAAVEFAVFALTERQSSSASWADAVGDCDVAFEFIVADVGYVLFLGGLAFGWDEPEEQYDDYDYYGNNLHMSLFFGEEVGVDFLYLIDLFGAYAYIVVNHIITELSAIDENYLDV